MNSETGRINFLVLGIGINVNQEHEDFAKNLRDTAISLKMFAGENRVQPLNTDASGAYLRSAIIKEVLWGLVSIYRDINAGDTGNIIDAWKRYSVTLGREVKVANKNGAYSGTAVDITKDGKLVVRCGDGTKCELLSGEVSVRGVMGYV
jgi:BirA family biotin operon repressor/biotin-[acetyl-CoA-carboxylase] ligase